MYVSTHYKASGFEKKDWTIAKLLGNIFIYIRWQIITVVNWFILSFMLSWTTDWNDHSRKPVAYHNSEQVYESRLEPVANSC